MMWNVLVLAGVVFIIILAISLMIFFGWAIAYAWERYWHRSYREIL